MKKTPRIAVILDENTSGDASRYEASKGYFEAVRRAGGLPFGVPYMTDLIPVVIDEFDGVVFTGGRYAFPDHWYLDGEFSKAPRSNDRVAVEQNIMEAYLARDKPMLGICAGMQTLACLNGCRLWADIQATCPNIQPHDQAGLLHPITLDRGSYLHAMVDTVEMRVNTFHREAIRQLSPGVRASAMSDDGIVEAIEVIDHRFAIGLQWHQERFTQPGHPGQAVFEGFINACQSHP
ncbi:MAG: gamma-glutamyl-gamma-aminobutyrate hydrolase family protein [Hyphomicrobiaceae bacterium]